MSDEPQRDPGRTSRGRPVGSGIISGNDTDVLVRLRGRYAQLLNGVIKVEDLDDEELAQGKLKDINGRFSGRPPSVIPGELVQAMRREWLSRAEAKLREALMEKGIGTLTALAGNEAIDPAVRLRAADKLIERTMGKVPDRIQFAAEDPVETLFRSILNDPEGLLESKAPKRELPPKAKAKEEKSLDLAELDELL